MSAGPRSVQSGRKWATIMTKRTRTPHDGDGTSEDWMELSDYLGLLRKRWLVIAVLALIGGGLGYAQGQLTTPTYRGTAKVWVVFSRGDTVAEVVQGNTFVQNVVQSYAALTTMPIVLEPVVETLGLTTTARNLAKTITVGTPLDTSIIEVSAHSSDPQRAAAVANAVADQLAVTAPTLSPTGPDGEAAVTIETVSPAHVPGAPIAPNTRLLAATGLAIGAALGVVIAVLRELLDTKVRSSKDVARVTGTAVLGSIALDRRPRRNQLVMRTDARSPRAESYRRLTTNLQFLDVGGKVNSFVVTSAVAGEGKSTTALNLALAIAETGRRAIIVDADLRRPSLAGHTGLEASAGLTTVLIGKAELADVVQPWGHPNLDVLASGPLPPNPTQMLGSQRMREVLDRLETAYDVIILDGTPVLPVADASILTRLTDGALLVVGCRKVHRAQLAEALGAIDAVGGRALGLVLNRTTHHQGNDYYTYDSAAFRKHRRLRTRQAAANMEDAPLAHDDLFTPFTSATTSRTSPAPGSEPEPAPGSASPVTPIAPSEADESKLVVPVTSAAHRLPSSPADHGRESPSGGSTGDGGATA